MVGGESDFVESVELEPLGSDINFSAAVKLDSAAHPQMSNPHENHSLRHDDCHLVYVLCGSFGRMMVKELEAEEAVRVLSAGAKPARLQELAAVRYTNPAYLTNLDEDGSISHFASIAEIVDPDSMECARLAVGRLEVIEASQPKRQMDQNDLGAYTRRIVLAVLYESLKCTAAQVFRTQLHTQSSGLMYRQSAVSVVRREIERLQADIADVKIKRQLFLSSWQEKWDDESKYMSNGEIQEMKVLLRDLFDKACDQEEQFTAAARNAIAQLQVALLGYIRRKRMAPSHADLWAFRLFDPLLTGAMPTPPVRTELFSLPQEGRPFADTLRPTADVTEELILMGKISSARHFMTSTILYDIPK